MGTGSIINLCWCWTHNSNPFWWFFPRPQVAATYTCTDHILLSIWGRSFTDIQSFLSKQLSTLWYSTLWILDMLAFPDSQNSYLNLESLLDFTWDLTSFLIAWKQSQGSKVGAIVELIQFVFHFWGITVLHCLMPVSWKLFYNVFYLFVGGVVLSTGRINTVPVTLSWPKAKEQRKF